MGRIPKNTNVTKITHFIYLNFFKEKNKNKPTNSDKNKIIRYA